MKPKAFAALAAITLAMLVVAVATYVSQNRVSQVRVSGEALFPGLAGKADRIAKIVRRMEREESKVGAHNG